MLDISWIVILIILLLPHPMPLLYLGNKIIAIKEEPHSP